MTRLRDRRGMGALAHADGFEFVSTFLLLAHERR